jgi:hypothetical protein
VNDELVALRRPFLLGVLAVVAVIVCLGGLIAAFGSNADRPAGIAERWLNAVSDSTRRGLAADADVRARELGAGPDLASRAGLVPAAAAAEAEAAFEDVRVGRAVPAGTLGAEEVVRVPFTVTPHDGERVTAQVFLARSERDGWHVVAVQPPGADHAVLEAVVVGTSLELAGTTGEVVGRPDHAPAGFFVGALALGVLIAAGCSAAIRAATPKR